MRSETGSVSHSQTAPETLMREQFSLSFDENRWRLTIPKPERTLQVFITNVCNKRCQGCFYDARLGKGHLAFDEYITTAAAARAEGVRKIILLGGEPTAHPELPRFLEWNETHGFKTTVYTNGTLLNRIEPHARDFEHVTWRVGVLGDTGFEKSVDEVRTQLPITLVYMLRKDNQAAMDRTVRLAEETLDVRRFMVSSIRDIAATKSYWKDTDKTISNPEYARCAQDFVHRYAGAVPELHISRRGVFTGPDDQNTCRYLNVFPDGTRVTCPLDISLDKRWTGGGFENRTCTKHPSCLLQKLVLTRI